MTAFKLICLALVLSPALPVLAQDSEPVPVPEQAQDKPATKPFRKPKLPSGFTRRTEDPYKDLIPGQLPKGTSPAAAKLHKALVKASALGGAESLTSFDLLFEIIVRGEGRQHNQGEVQVSYMEPDFVRFSIDKQYEMGFGPPGFWQRFEDGAKLLKGRDYVADIKRITEVRAIAKNFLAMADPHRLRLTALKAMDAPPKTVPPGSQTKMAKLDWLSIDSPDFDLALGASTASNATRLFRTQLGLNRETGRVEEALVQELIAGKPVVTTSTWVSSAEPMRLGKATLPGALFVRYPNTQTIPWSFETRAREEVYLIEGALNPKMVPADFGLPRK